MTASYHCHCLLRGGGALSSSSCLLLSRFKIKLPPGRKAGELSSTERDSEKESKDCPSKD